MSTKIKNTFNSFSSHILRKHRQAYGKTQKLTEFLGIKIKFNVFINSC
jgi:hypothetical protein